MGWRQKGRRQGGGVKDKKKSAQVRPGKSQVETELSPHEAGGGGQAPVMETPTPNPLKVPLSQPGGGHSHQITLPGAGGPLLHLHSRPKATPT